MREKILIIIYLLFLMSNSIYAQDNKKEELYLDILEFVLSEQVFDINEMMFVYENDTSFFYCRYENFVESSEKRYEFTYNENKIKVSVFNTALIGGYGISVGKGFSYLEKNALFTAGIFLTTSSTTMAGEPYMTEYNDFLPESPVLPIESPITGIEKGYTASFSDKRYNRGGGVMGVTITQNSFSSNLNPTNGFVILDYLVHNDNSDSLKNLYFKSDNLLCRVGLSSSS